VKPGMPTVRRGGPPSRRTRVLLVAGDKDFLERVVDSVANDPRVAVVGRAYTGEAAIAGIRALKPDMVWMDEALPDADAFELTRRVKTSAAAPWIVLLSSRGDRGARAEARAAGADGFLEQTDIEDLMPLVAELLLQADERERTGDFGVFRPADDGDGLGGPGVGPGGRRGGGASGPGNRDQNRNRPPKGTDADW